MPKYDLPLMIFGLSVLPYISVVFTELTDLIVEVRLYFLLLL